MTRWLVRREKIIIIEAETEKEALERNIEHSFDAIEIYMQQTAVACDELVAFARRAAKVQAAEEASREK